MIGDAVVVVVICFVLFGLGRQFVLLRRELARREQPVSADRLSTMWLVEHDEFWKGN